ncbi:MAG TPA: ABC transporter ATP-binding protein [bacterium]|nr:ABC transporter ATP-binding protein [bacterium]
MLAVRGLTAGYGDVEVLRAVDLDVAPGEIVALVGANGAGKSTLLKCISGLLAPAAGTIQLDGHSIGGLPPARIVRLGIAHVPEGRQIFSRLTVADNLMLGAYSGLRDLTREGLAARTAEVCGIFPALLPRLAQEASLLSGGQQQMLAVARGLMARPRLLMLDEPSLGLAPVLTAEIFAILRDLRTAGVGLLIVEQNARMSLAIADRGYVLETGRVVLAGTGRDLARTPEVIHRYLGVGAARVEGDDTAAAAALAVRLTAVLGEGARREDSPPPKAEGSTS